MMKEELEKDLEKLKTNREVFVKRAQIYSECGLDKRAADFAAEVEAHDKLIDKYNEEIKALETEEK